ncbi:MAG: class I SAM-dependent methyltransferase [Opitutaceae bacterium]
MSACLDAPVAGACLDPLGFVVRGWVRPEPPFIPGEALEVWADDACLGRTLTRYVRPDVNQALGLPADAACGFELAAHHPGAGRAPFTLELRRRPPGGEAGPALVQVTVTPIPRDYRQNHFGVLLDQRTTAIQRRANIWATGPSQAEGSPELADLLRRHLGPPPRRVLDVGCGLGSYGRGLLAAGYDWHGVEVNPEDCAELARLGLPHRQVDGRTLPFADGAYAAALCLEVLEHVDEPRAFLREIARVAPAQLIVSVPNCELLGYLWDHLATPWHMLEASHVNFFTRWSLGALLREFWPEVEVGFHTLYPLRTPEGLPLYYNLIACARRSDLPAAAN